MGWNPANWSIVNTLQGQPNYEPAQNSGFVSGSAGGGGGGGGGGGYTAPRPTQRNNSAPASYSGTYEGGGYSTGGGGGSAASPNASDLAYLDSQNSLLRKQLERANAGLDQGLKGLSDSYNKEQSSANLQRSRALEGFNTQRTDTTNDKLKAVGSVNTNARTLADSVRRMLGLASGSNSSAYKQAAPGAIARNASIQRGNVNDTYGKNFRNLDTAEGQAKVDFANLLTDLLDQKKQRESDLRAGVLDNQNSISEKLASIAAEKARVSGGGYDSIMAAQKPFERDISNRNKALDGLFARFRTPYSVKPVNVQTPDLGKYTVDRQSINANRGGDTSQYSPYSQPLKKKFNEAL